MVREEEHFRPLLKPGEIYERSFAIIRQEMGAHAFTAEQFSVVQRVIHATADFELGRSLVFHPAAIREGVKAIRAGKGVVTDVRMVQAGLLKRVLQTFGNSIRCWIGEEAAVELARKEGITCAMAGIRLAAPYLEGAVAVVGNAPTALIELVRLVREEGVRPALIVGVPVGFVSVQESKELLMGLMDVPHVTNRGRKGGSPTAAAIVNALALMARGEDGKG